MNKLPSIRPGHLNLAFLICFLALSHSNLCAATSEMKPTVIAHRGASGYLPEHTLEAYTLAHAQGADYIEQDLVLTRDRQLICLHDLYLEPTTNVESMFPDRKRSDGHWYAIDFNLSEIKQLSVHERLPNRFPQERSHFTIPTFTEAVQLIEGLNQRLPHKAGIYPELKRPSFHREASYSFEEIFVETLHELEFDREDKHIFIQCFELDSLRRLREISPYPYPLIYLMGNSRETREQMSDGFFAEISEFVQGLGPSKSLLSETATWIQHAQSHGLLIHPYTFRADDAFPSAEDKNFAAELDRYLWHFKVDGLFTDFPDLVRQAVDSGPK